MMHSSHGTLPLQGWHDLGARLGFERPHARTARRHRGANCPINANAKHLQPFVTWFNVITFRIPIDQHLGVPPFRDRCKCTILTIPTVKSIPHCDVPRCRASDGFRPSVRRSIGTELLIRLIFNWIFAAIRTPLILSVPWDRRRRRVVSDPASAPSLFGSPAVYGIGSPSVRGPIACTL